MFSYRPHPGAPADPGAVAAAVAAAAAAHRFCAKGSLYGLLHSPGCYLSWVQVVAMLLDAAKGMEHLHANSVLHRWVELIAEGWVDGTQTQSPCGTPCCM